MGDPEAEPDQKELETPVLSPSQIQAPSVARSLPPNQTYAATHPLFVEVRLKVMLALFKSSSNIAVFSAAVFISAK